MFYDQPMVGELMNAVRELKERPEVVYCEECKHSELMAGTKDMYLCKEKYTGCTADDFCRYGERKMEVKHSCLECIHKRDILVPCEWLEKQTAIILDCPYFEREKEDE